MVDRRLFSLVDGCKDYLARIVAGKWVALLVNISIIWILALLAQALLVPGADRSILAPSSLGLAAAALLAAILIRSLALYLSDRKTDKLQLLVMTSIRQKLYDKLLGLGSSYQEVASLPEALQTAGEGVTQLQTYFARYLPQLIYAGLAPVTLFAILVWQAGWAAALLLLLVPLIPVSIVFVQKPARRAARKYWESYVDLGGEFLQAVAGLTTLKIFQADGRYAEKLDGQAESFRKTTMSMLSVQLRSIVLMDLFAYGGAAGGIILALHLYNLRSITFVGCFLLIFLSQEFFLPMRQLGSLFHAGMGGLAASRKIYEILDVPQQVPGQVELEGLKAIDKSFDITLNQVSYGYGDRSALHQVSLTIPEQGMFALVGQSGSGKSTLAAIIGARKRDYQGKVFWGQTDYRTISESSLMEQITLVDSHAYLFATTIRENLLMAVASATDEQLYAALDRAQVGEFVRSAGGLDFVIQEDGANISRGQAQRIALARALLHDSQVYIFDEVTSAVDAASEQAIAQVMKELSETKCCIVIAHRLELVKDADTICVMEDGRLVQSGTHQQLLSEGGSYAELWQHQSELVAFAQEKGYAGRDGLLGGQGQAEAVEDLHRSLAEEDRETLAEDLRSASPNLGAFDIRKPLSGWKALLSLLVLMKPLTPYVILAVVLGSLGHLAAIIMPSIGAVSLMDVTLFRPVAARFDFPIDLSVPFMLLAVCGLLRGPLRYGEQLSNHYIAFRLLAHIRHEIFAKLRQLAPARLEGRGKGDILALVTSDVELLEVFFAHTVSPVLIALIVSLFILGFISAGSSVLVLVALVGYLLVGVVLPAVTSRMLKGKGQRMRQENAGLTAFVLDQLKGMDQTIQYGQGPASSRRLAQENREVSASEYDLKQGAALNQALLSAVQTLVCLVFMAVAFLTAPQWGGELALPLAFIVSMVYLSSFGPVMAVSQLAGTLPQTIGSAQRVVELLLETPAVDEVEKGLDVTFEEAQFNQVDFAYDGQQVLHEVNLNISDGEILCISGPSGSGKSTLLKLLMRFWDVDRGSVELNFANVKDITTASLRSNEAYMTQDTFLFEDSIKDNILLVKPDASDRQLLGALASAHLEDFISRLPEGLDTQVGDLEGRLSGGERQRIGLARAFLYNAPLILLDEPTSNLDALSEASVMKAIAEGRSGKTFVVVSHRPSTAAFADRFVYMDRGHIN